MLGVMLRLFIYDGARLGHPMTLGKASARLNTGFL